MRRALYIVMALSSWELLDLAGDPLNGWGELRLIWGLRAQEQDRVTPSAPAPLSRPALAKAA
jgi:hypothetical protein